MLKIVRTDSRIGVYANEKLVFQGNVSALNRWQYKTEDLLSALGHDIEVFDSPEVFGKQEFPQHFAGVEIATTCFHRTQASNSGYIRHCEADKGHDGLHRENGCYWKS